MSLFSVATLVLIFILKLRFPPKTPFTTIITKRYNRSTLTLYRKYEKLDFKVRKIELDISFLQNCKAHGITLEFLNCKVHNPKVTLTLTYK